MNTTTSALSISPLIRALMSLIFLSFRAEVKAPPVDRRCERSEAIQGPRLQFDDFVSALDSWIASLRS
jgi:hypothetical protein